MGVRPVTQAHWSAIMGSNPSKFQEGWSAGLRPVESITSFEVQTFLNLINEQNLEFIGFRGRWRLPSEVEWEYVAKAGSSTRWSFGNKDSELDAHGWHAGNSGATTREVGSKKSNQWGFHDFHGLIYEMTGDAWSSSHEHHDGTQASASRVDSNHIVAKGGSWFTESDSTRSSSRRKVGQDDRRDGIGFRLVWEPVEPSN